MKGRFAGCIGRPGASSGHRVPARNAASNTRDTGMRHTRCWLPTAMTVTQKKAGRLGAGREPRAWNRFHTEHALNADGSLRVLSRHGKGRGGYRGLLRRERDHPVALRTGQRPIVRIPSLRRPAGIGRLECAGW